MSINNLEELFISQGWVIGKYNIKKTYYKRFFYKLNNNKITIEFLHKVVYNKDCYKVYEIIYNSQVLPHVNQFLGCLYTEQDYYIFFKDLL